MQIQAINNWSENKDAFSKEYLSRILKRDKNIMALVLKGYKTKEWIIPKCFSILKGKFNFVSPGCLPRERRKRV